MIRLSVRIDNTGTHTLAYFPCGTSLQMRGGGGWDPVWAPTCSLIAGEVEIGPGQSFEGEWPVHIQNPRPSFYRWPDPDGEYAVRVTLREQGRTLEGEHALSRPFRLVLVDGFD